jgi:SNF2 family DNA or RNA helicase
MVIDESSTIRTSTAKRTQNAILLGMKAVANRISTGSLIDNSPLNAYSQFEFLKHGCLGFTSYYSFRAHYAELVDVRMGEKKFKKVAGYRNLEDLRKRLSLHSFIIKKEDCLDLPEKIYQTYNVDLTVEQVAAYSAMKKRCMAEINGELVSAKIVLTKLLRLHQIVCGSTKLDSGETVEIKSNRVQALLDILEETSGQVIVWATYRADIFAIKKALDLEYGTEATLTYFGDSSDDEKQKAKRVFYRGNDAEGVRFLVSNPVTGGFGNNFTSCTTHIYFSNDYNAETRNQSEDRSHRIGQTERVTYIDLVCPGTVDEKIIAALKKKKSLSDEITLSNWLDYV